jgi:SAM-dependent methyltransferase
MRERESIEQRFAQFYQLYVGDFRQDIPIYLDLAAKYRGPVLDVGCGTGRVASHLAAAVRISQLDLRRTPLPERFRVALVTLHTFNFLIDVEEQRLFLRHLRHSVWSPGVVALDLFCPLSLVRPEIADQCRTIERTYGDQRVLVRDLREMLTPLLERRIQIFRMNDDPEAQVVTHRRFITPWHAVEEAGFEGMRCIENYDLATARPCTEEEGVRGPFLILAEA